MCDGGFTLAGVTWGAWIGTSLWMLKRPVVETLASAEQLSATAETVSATVRASFVIRTPYAEAGD